MKSAATEKNALGSVAAKTGQFNIGAHFSIAKGLHEAIYTAKSYGCNALQLFTKNATTWKERTITEKEIVLFEKARKETGIDEIAAHASYLINIASPDRKKHSMSARALKQELIRSSALKIAYCILHPGAHMDDTMDAGIQKIADTLNDIFEQTSGKSTRLLLETTAGQGTIIGHTFEQLARIMEKIENKARVGVCLDTCHIFVAGYDIRTEAAYHQTIDTFASVLGLETLFAIHFNDSKKDLGSRVDRHEHIGKGFIGMPAFECFVNDSRFFHVPKILETPKGGGMKDWDKQNLEVIRGLVHVR
jgi:deoxyribonuclease-4